MSTTVAFATFEASSDLHSLLRQIDPSSFRAEKEAETRLELDRIIARVDELLAQSASTPTAPGLGERLTRLSDAFERARKTETESARAWWANLLREVHPAYEALAAWLRREESLPAKSLRPTNYARNLFHVGSALVALTVLIVAPSRIWVMAASGSLFVTFWTLEILRRTRPQMNEQLMALFGKVAHAHERYRVNSSTWYMTALILLASFAQPAVSAIAVMVLGCGDPAAAIVGRRFGKTKLRSGRSLEGTLAFAGVSFVVALAVAIGMLPGTMTLKVVAAVVAAATGAIVEVFSTRVDDNLTIPLSVGAAVSVAVAILG